FLLFQEERSLKQKVHFVLFLAIPLALGVLIRFDVKTFQAGDLAFESAIIMGVIGGRFAGFLGAVLVSLPAMLHGELATMPLNAAAGFVAGVMRALAKSPEDIWSFSPFFDLSF